MTITLVLPESVGNQFQKLVTLEVETGGVLLARPVPSNSGALRLLATELHLVPEDAYTRREAQRLSIRSHGYVPSLQRAEETATIPIWVHTHPGAPASPQPSYLDRLVDEQLSDLFRLRSGSEHYGSLILGLGGSALRYTGFLDSAGPRAPIDRLFSIGLRFRLAWHEDTHISAADSLFDRNIRAFGGAVQNALHDLRVGLVGCGGIGSSVAEQLARLGVRRFLLMDPDSLSDNNVTRVYGSGLADVGRPKVDVIGDQIIRIAPDASIDRITSMATVERAARRLADVDVLFGCTDDNAGRLVLSRLSTYMLIPVIDCGVLLSSDRQGSLDGIFGRVTILTPGSACLVCRKRIDLQRAAAEVLTPDERVRRIGEGYAPALPGVEPAVVAFTTHVAALAVGELIERFVGYGTDETPSELIARIHERELSTNKQDPKPRHYCHPDSGKTGIGFTEPFLEQSWQR